MPEREADPSVFLVTTPITCAVNTTVSAQTKPMNKGFSIQHLLCVNESSGIKDNNEDQSGLNLNMQHMSTNTLAETIHYLRDNYTNEEENSTRESNRNERTSKLSHLTATSHDRLAVLFNLLQHNYGSLKTSHSSVSNMFNPLYGPVGFTEVPDLVNLGILKSDIASNMVMSSVSNVDGTSVADFGPSDTKMPVKQISTNSNEDTQCNSTQMAVIMPANISHNQSKSMDSFFPFMLQNTVSGYASIPIYSRETSGSKQCRRRKARTVFSDNQLLGLEHRFGTQHYLSTPERIELANQLSLSETQVKTWFQNRRMKHKKMKRGGYLAVSGSGTQIVEASSNPNERSIDYTVCKTNSSLSDSDDPNFELDNAQTLGNDMCSKKGRRTFQLDMKKEEVKQTLLTHSDYNNLRSIDPYAGASFICSQVTAQSIPSSTNKKHFDNEHMFPGSYVTCTEEVHNPKTDAVNCSSSSGHTKLRAFEFLDSVMDKVLPEWNFRMAEHYLLNSSVSEDQMNVEISPNMTKTTSPFSSKGLTQPYLRNGSVSWGDSAKLNSWHVQSKTPIT
ncbi:hypothetical protein EG68_00861 [Paragonimus skrjabini miyazakii]|uniref:Homeobox domain-containing protein n=1 Tax=Paragonimus skrjabini miyazakii TaxID=59628 RepID=A0A8S9Z3I7_9TREM|nr:hypothetical protein EG68_00861 [Paragonimus skrjabini miyazakii]